MSHVHRSLTFIAVLASLVPLEVDARPVRLFEVFAVHITVDGTGFHTMHRGRFNAAGAFDEFELGALPAGVTPPPEAMNRMLITFPTAYAYEVLGPEALANFEIGTKLCEIGSQGYYAIAPAATAKLDVGTLVNISTRGTIAPGAAPLIAGFIVEEHPRWVLIRGVGPTLSDHGVTDALADPEIAVFPQGENQAMVSNDDWSQRPEADEIEQRGEEVGAFPLVRDSKDAACLVLLPAGGYTVHVSTPGATGGTALVEVYLLP